MNESFSSAFVLASSRPSDTAPEYPPLLEIGAKSVSAFIPFFDPMMASMESFLSGAVLGSHLLAQELARTAGPRNPFAYGTASELA